MSNPHRGEVELKAGDKSYTLAFTINSVCELEAKLDKSLGDIVADMGRMVTIRAVLWAGLRQHHKVEIEEAGEIMQLAGAAATAQAINQAMTSAFPPAEAGAARKNR